MSFSVNKLNVLSLYLDEVHKVICVISDTDVNNESKINYFITVSFCISLSGDQQQKKSLIHSNRHTTVRQPILTIVYEARPRYQTP